MNIYQNPKEKVYDRVKSLLSLMSLDEKLAQMHAQWLILDAQGNHQERETEFTGNPETQKKLSIQERLKNGLGQITRPLGTHVINAEEGVKALNALQKYLIEKTRLGIPALPHEECLVGLMTQGATLFPSALNYGHTWNPGLIEKVGQSIGGEVRSIGAKQGLAPVLDVSRDVRWGRTEETFGEDPYHVGLLATQYVKGLQGENRDVYATLKHFAGHSFSEGARNHASVNIGPKELNDIFLLPFEMAIKLGNAGSVMPAYHDIDNDPCHSSYHLLTKILREDWGFDGLIVADYVGVELLSTHHGIAEDAVAAAAMSFNAGLDIELPDDKCTRHAKEAVQRGLLTEQKVDEIVSRILTVKFEMGLFENPYVDIKKIAFQQEETKEVAYQVALQSAVLLENNGVLPLKKENNIAIIGPTADDPLALLGGYSFPVHLILSDLEDITLACPTLLDVFKTSFSQVTYSKGCDILSERKMGAPVFPGDIDISIEQQEMVSPVSLDTSAISEAVEIARKCDYAIVCIGDLAGLFQTGTVGEGSDTDNLNLPGVQQTLLEAVIATGTPTVILITGGRPYNLQGAETAAAAVLIGWEPGQEGARALNDIIIGKASPSGRLTISIPKSAGATPYYYNHKLKSGGTPIAYHFGSKYNFGYGLTYTDFTYDNLQISKKQIPMNGEINIRVDIENTGSVKGCEIVQLYIRDRVCSQVRPIKELKGFQRVELLPGEKAQVIFKLPVDMLNFTNNEFQRIVEPGTFSIMIGKSSADILLSDVVEILGEINILPKYWKMVCQTMVVKS